METNILVDISPLIPYLVSLVLELWAKLLSTNQIAGFSKILYLKKEVNDEVCFWHADKHQSILQVEPDKHKLPKIRSLRIFAISPEKHGEEVDFLPVNKQESFLQVDSSTLDLLSQACPKYPIQ